jgi:ribosomal protein S3AE
MLRKSISYVEDSFHTQTKESDIIIKPFLITRKTVSRTIRKTLRNSARNWIMDYTKTKNDDELFEDILNGKMQKDLSIKLKKIYPLALCEIRILEIKNLLNKPEKKNK